MIGTVLVQFQLSASGTLMSASVARSSGNILLDRIALRTLRQSSPFPAPPGDLAPDQLLFAIPVRFH